MLTHARAAVWRAERAAAEAGVVGALQQLRRLGLADFSDVMLAMPDPTFTALSSLLPGMPDGAVQRSLSGSSGKALMHDGVSFLRVVAGGYRDLTGAPARGATILDFGCGWGRLLRLLMFFADPERLTGLEPDVSALDLAQQTGVLGRLERWDFRQAGLPTGTARFDLIVAHALFGHMALAVMDAAMAALRASIAERGVLALTVRPIEFWDFRAQQGDADAPALREEHVRSGFSSRLETTATPFGEATIDLDWFSDRYPQWELRGADRGWDELRTILLLTPR